MKTGFPILTDFELTVFEIQIIWFSKASHLTLIIKYKNNHIANISVKQWVTFVVLVVVDVIRDWLQSLDIY